ncbi:MAG: alpha/beta hydrolase [Luteolibacter sp.]
MNTRHILTLACGIFLSGHVLAEAPKPQPPPSQRDVAYGDHSRQILDFYQAKSDSPAPVVIYLHGGGWTNGSKESVSKRDYAKLLDAGISVVSINYRYVSQAREAKVEPPVKWPMEDVARAVQFVRSKASEWNVDPQKIAGSGGSAGACSILWLALHDDLANPDSPDPVARQSTRLACVALDGAQTTLDPKEMREWTPNSRYGGHAFGISSPEAKSLPSGKSKSELNFEEFYRRRDEILPWIKQYSPIEFATSDDPPVYLWFKAPPALGQSQKDPTHSANFGVKLQEKLKNLNVPCEVYYPGTPEASHSTIEDYLIHQLSSSRPETR